MRITELKNYVQNGELDTKLEELYGSEQTAAQKERYLSILNKAEKLYGDREASLFSAPGRTEVGGNHTDHQLGKVLAASLNLDVLAVVIATEDNVIRYASKGFEVAPVDITDLSIHNDEANTTEALIRGTAAGFAAAGYKTGGFCAYAESDVLPGSGMSSSAAFEVLLGTILNHLYNDGAVSPEFVAKNGQYAENVYFMKPCGLLDQMACSVGSFAAMDFADPANPVVEKVDFDPADYGFDLILTDCKASHAELSHEYAAIPLEMKQVARLLGQEVLGRCTMEQLVANAAVIRKDCGDRAFLRAYHFLNETVRAEKEAKVLQERNIDAFLELIKESGRSSWMYLQNVNVNGDDKNQSLGVGLALSEEVIGNSGAWRVHGGGFAGTIQAFVRHEDKERYIAVMNSVFGSDSCYVLKIRNCGGIRIA
ncbi:MAG: galactokinase [Solobacterium sp.]|nr:galactokinase [Solobacterium sp.]